MRSSIATMSLICAAACIWTGTARADSQALYDKECSRCHELADFAGRPAAQIEDKIKAVVNGTIKHKRKLTLSDEQIKELSAYLSAAK